MPTISRIKTINIRSHDKLYTYCIIRCTPTTATSFYDFNAFNERKQSSIVSDKKAIVFDETEVVLRRRTRAEMHNSTKTDSFGRLKRK